MLEFNFTPVEFDIDLPEPEPAAPPVEMIVVPVGGERHVVEFKNKALWAPGSNLLSLINQMEALNSDTADREARIKELTELREELRREFARRADELDTEKANIQHSLSEERAAKRDLAWQITAAENIFREALEAQRVQAEFLRQSEEYDRLTATAYWREFALQHQIDGAKYITAAQRCILADKPGLGKTLTSLITCDMRQSKKVLVVVPDDVAKVFHREILHWTPHRNVLLMAKQVPMVRKMVLDTLENFDEFTVVINYSAWRKDSSLLDRLVSLRFDTVIMDEAHQVKNTRTAAYKGCRQVVLSDNQCPVCSSGIKSELVPKALLSEAGYRWDQRQYHWVCTSASCPWSEAMDVINDVSRPAYSLSSVKTVIPMTGTPILNKPEDLFALLSLVDPVHFADVKEFNRTYCVQNFYTSRWEFKPGGLERLVRSISGKYIGRDRKSAGVVLPKQEVIVHSIEFDKDAYPAQYEVITNLTKKAMFIMREHKIPMLSTIELILRKRQANVWPAGINFKFRNADGDIVGEFNVGDEIRESIKLDAVITDGPVGNGTGNGSGELSGLIPDLEGERIVLFSQFKTPLVELERRCREAGLRVVRFDGSTPEHIRDQIKLDFDRRTCDVEGYETKWDIVLANYKTGGVGLNLNAATQTIILDEEWNPGKEEQAFNRTDRMGQTQETQVHIIRVEKTIDDWMAELIEQKRKMAGGFEAKATIDADKFLKGMESGEML